MSPNTGDISHTRARTAAATFASSVLAIITGGVVYGVVHCLRTSPGRGGELIAETCVGVLVALFCVSGGWTVRRFLRSQNSRPEWLVGWIVVSVVLAVVYAAFYFSVRVN